MQKIDDMMFIIDEDDSINQTEDEFGKNKKYVQIKMKFLKRKDKNLVALQIIDISSKILYN